MSAHQKLIGQSAPFLQVLERASQVAPLSRPVLVIGERGTGKEQIVERIHYLSPRWEQVLVKLNCAALPESLLETELFGYEPGAFTGASKRHAGRFERAQGGTLFLDEIASMSLRLQEKLLRVVEYGEFERVGGTEVLNANVRVIGAANADLPAMARKGKFRADLLDRLSFDVISLPPLRYRREDIPLLAEFFALNMVKELRRQYFPGFSESALQSLCSYDWPGNVRELKNVVERAVYRTAPEAIIDSLEFNPFQNSWLTEPPQESPQNRPRFVPNNSPDLPYNFKGKILQFEAELLNQALIACQYNQRRTAKALGLSYNQLRGYLRKHQLLPNQNKRTK